MTQERPLGVWLAGALYLAITVVFAYPLSLHAHSHLFTYDSDTKLIQWILGWDVHAFTTQPLRIFDANIFAPLPNTLAYAEHLIGNAILAAPIIWLTDNSILAINVVSLLSIPVGGMGAFLLARRLGVTPAGALIAGLIFAFAPPRFFRLSQLHITSIQWLPFCLAYLHTYLDHHRPGDLRIALALFSVQALSGGHGSVFLTISICALLLYRFALGDPIAVTRRMRDMGVTGALALLPAILVFLPYLRARSDAGLARTLAGWRTPAANFLASPSHVHQWVAHLFPSWLREAPDAFLFPGYLPLLLPLAGAAVWLAGRRRPDWIRWITLLLELVFVAAAAVALWALATEATRLRVGGVTVLTVRNAWRPWIMVLLAAGLRLALQRRAPLDLRQRMARTWSACRAQRRNAALFYTLLTLFGVWLLLGPPFGIWQVIYDWPLLNFIRVPTRFSLVVVLALGVLSGLAFDRLTRAWPPRRSAVAAACVAVLLLAELAAFPLAAQDVRQDLPAIDRWLATQPAPVTVAEAPMPRNPEDYDAQNARNATYMVHSMAHWQKTVHGFSGVLPASHQALYEAMAAFPSDDALDRMRSLGVTHVVYHADMTNAATVSEVDALFATFGQRLTPEHTERDGRVYRLRQ